MPRRINHAIAVIPVLAFAIVMTIGCAHVQSSVKAVGNIVGAGATRLSEQRLHDAPEWFTAVGPQSVDVDIFRGSVTIEANPKLDHGVVTVTRRATHGSGRADEASRSLEEIDYAYEIVPGPLGPTLKLHAWTTHAEPHFQRVDVTIELPEIDTVKVRSRDGNVRVVGQKGAVDIVTSDGDVRVMTPWPMLHASTIINHSGSIDLRIRGESTARIDGQALRGRVFNRVTRGQLHVYPGTDHDTLVATLNDGENPVVLRAADGDIRIAVVPDPTAVGLFIVD